MFDIFRKTKPSDAPVIPDLSFIQTDFHSHFIPGIDDGSPDIETSLELIRGLMQMGYTKIITTPHVMAGRFHNTPEIILSGLEELREAARENNLAVELYAAAEYFMDEHFEILLTQKKLLPVSKNEVLVEMSFMAPPPNLHALIFEIQTQGYQPILAHPERYGFFHRDMEEYARLKNLGCKLQVNINSLTGYYGKSIKAIANKLLDNQLIDYVGSDMHNIKHLQAMQSLGQLKEVLEKLRNYPLQNKNL